MDDRRRQRAFVALADQWREQALHMDGAAFAAHLGRDKSEWSMLRAGKRQPSRSFIAAVLRKAPEPWKSALEKAHLADLTRDADPLAVPA